MHKDRRQKFKIMHVIYMRHKFNSQSISIKIERISIKCFLCRCELFRAVKRYKNVTTTHANYFNAGFYTRCSPYIWRAVFIVVIVHFKAGDKSCGVFNTCLRYG